jgi:hypothetical protein
MAPSSPRFADGAVWVGAERIVSAAGDEGVDVDGLAPWQPPLKELFLIQGK